MIRRSHPGGDLCSRAESELVHDVADAGVNGALGDEQPRSDLLVAQAGGHESRHLCFSLAEYAGSPYIRGSVREGGAIYEFVLNSSVEVDWPDELVRTEAEFVR